MKFIYSLILIVLISSCQNDDELEQATVSFYPNLIVALEEPEDTQTVEVTLEVSKRISTPSSVKVEVYENYLAYGLNYVTVPAMLTSKELYIEIAPNQTKASFEVVLMNDQKLSLEDLYLLFTITGGNGDIKSIGREEFRIEVEDNTGPLVETNFDNCESDFSNNFSEVLGVGPEFQTESSWACTTFGNTGSAIEANAFQNDDTTESNAYLISNPFDVSNLNSLIISAAIQSFYSGGGVVTAVYSVDYPGSGNPDDYTWTGVEDFNTQIPEAGSRTWTDITATLSGFNGSQLYFAFLFKGGKGGNSSSWAIDDFKVIGQ